MTAQFRPRELARLCGVSLRTLQRYFQGRYGLTVSRWLLDQRLLRAKEQLKSGAAVKVVAVELYFKQLSHFSRSFKQRFGAPPSAFSRSFAAKNDLKSNAMAASSLNLDSDRGGRASSFQSNLLVPVEGVGVSNRA